MPDEVKVLDHGYVRIITTWGSDMHVIEAARMSTDKGFQGWGHPCDAPGCMPVELPGDLNACEHCKGTGFIAGDEKLLRYLYTHKHMTPFEMAGMVVEVQAPIFVFREWHRHRTQSYNELSARYTALPDLFYMPSIERLMNSAQSTSNKQSSAAGIDAGMAKGIQENLHATYQHTRRAYEFLLRDGVSREVARCVVPVAQYSRMRASANLRNWLAFLTLRQDNAAQYEIRQYANAVAEHIGIHFPRTYNLFKVER